MAGFLFAALIAVWVGTVPAPTHAIPLELPPPSVHHDAATLAQAMPPVVHAVTLQADGAIAWDGKPVSEADLIARLNATWEEQRAPGITFEPSADAAYGNVIRVLNIMHASGVTSHHFCLKGMGQYEAYEHTKPALPKDGQTADQACADDLIWDMRWAI